MIEGEEREMEAQAPTRQFSLLFAALLGALSALVVAALTYLGWRLGGLPFVPFDLFDWLARVLPGALVTFFIDLLVRIIIGFNLGPTADVAKLVEQALALVLFSLLGAVFGFVLGAIGRRRPELQLTIGAVGGMVLLVPILLVEAALGFPAAGPVLSISWLAAVFAGWGATLGWLLQEVTPQREVLPGSPVSRRQFLYLIVAGSFTAVVAALRLGLFSEEEAAEEATQASVEELLQAHDTSGPAASPPVERLARRMAPAPGTRPELTSNRDFYRIDINTFPPNIDGETWRLEVAGLVERPLSLSLEDLRARPAASQVITLECISNTVGGDLISTALWTGVRLKDILAEAGLRPGAQEVFIRSTDGFFESVNQADMLDERTLLVYEMNGVPLPVEHGFPLRIYIPNRFGMKQPKWITSLEVIDHDGPGYWVERGWSVRAIPPTTSVIDAVALQAMDPQTETAPVGGIAYAGDRGISKVEVQVDDGPWEAAELRTPALSPLTWVQWRYAWRAQPGRHTLRVRAYDGSGALQIERQSSPHPNGATGIHSFDVRVE